MFEIVNRKAPEDRRAVPFDPTVLTAAPAGTIISLDAATDLGILASGDVPDPMWVFTDPTRLDAAEAESVTVVEGPFVARVDTDGYVGSPTAGAYLAVGTAGNAGKLVVATLDADATVNAPIVARCLKAPDGDGVILFKAIR